MTQPCLDRRGAALMALAGALWPVSAWADFTTPPLIPRPPLAPQPPADIGVFTDLYRRMTAPVRINGQGPFAFVVDTGANRSVVSAELAAQLALPRGPDQSLNDAAGVRSAPAVSARLAVGGREARELVLSVLPAETIGGQGMLGLDRLADQRLTLDFQGQQLRIEGAHGSARDPLDVVVRARRKSGQLTLVDADLAGAPITAFLDSGSQTTIGNPALHALARAKDPKGLWSSASIVSATGQTIPAEVANLPNLRVGGLRMQHLSVAFADLHTFHLWDLTGRPTILLGVDVLSRFDAVQLDFARGEVRFRLPATA
jgi:predicted aspartyl protease